MSGLSQRGVSDLYRVALPGGELEPLTNDHYQDLDPSPSADGRRVVFASDRTADGRGGAANLFLLDLASGATTQLTSGDWRTSLRCGRRTAASISRPTATACSTSSPSIPPARAAARPPPGPAPSTPCRWPEAVWWSGGFHDLSWNLYRIPVDSSAHRERFARVPDAAAAGAVGLGCPGRHRDEHRGPQGALPPAPHARFRRGRRGRDPGLRRRAGHLLRRERSARRQPAVRLGLLVPGPPPRQHLLEHQRHRDLPESDAGG